VLPEDYKFVTPSQQIISAALRDFQPSGSARIVETQISSAGNAPWLQSPAPQVDRRPGKKPDSASALWYARHAPVYGSQPSLFRSAKASGNS
jgi:hypothetical protein